MSMIPKTPETETEEELPAEAPADEGVTFDDGTTFDDGSSFE